MGNHRFRWSDMMPNSWFNKLKDMGGASRGQSIRHSSKGIHPPTTTNKASTIPKPFPPPLQVYPPQRTSYYFPSRLQTEQLPHSPFNPKASDIHFPIDTPRKSNRKTGRRPTKPSAKLLSSSVLASCDHRETMSSVPKPDSVLGPGSPPHCDDYKNGNGDELRKRTIANQLEFDSCRVTSSATEIIIDMGSKNCVDGCSKIEDTEALLELRLPPILTKPAKKGSGKQGRQNGKGRALNEINRSPARRSASGLHRIKVRPSSPLGNKKARNQKTVWPNPAVKQSKVLSESFLVVKSSLNPPRDFRESMVEMITKNSIRAPEDLEELLACYLSLNSIEYHDVIVKVFEQIWFDLCDNRL